MGDLIGRQAAIKAIEDLPNCYNGFSDTYDKSCIIGVLEELPSAQPEIVRCKDCYYCVAEKCWGRTFYYCDVFSYHAEGDLIGVSLQVSPDHFCGWAERRTDE